MTLAEEYREAIEAGLRWNVENAHLYKPGNWAVVALAYEKTSKGKSRHEKTILGVVPKDDAGRFIAELSIRWAMHADNLQKNFKPLPSIDLLEFTSFNAYIGWRRGEQVIDDEEIERRHGVIDMEKAFKQLKSL